MRLKLALSGFFWFVAVFAFGQDTTHYVNGSVSTITTPWNEGQQQVLLFDLKGNQTQVFTRVQRSFSVDITLVFAKNGSVFKLTETIHPGGSPCSIVVSYQFNGTNEPLLKTVEYSFGPLCSQERETWFWNRKAKSWVKQETISCMPAKGY